LKLPFILETRQEGKIPDLEDIGKYRVFLLGNWMAVFFIGKVDENS